MRNDPGKGNPTLSIEVDDILVRRRAYDAPKDTPLQEAVRFDCTSIIKSGGLSRLKSSPSLLHS